MEVNTFRTQDAHEIKFYDHLAWWCIFPWSDVHSHVMNDAAFTTCWFRDLSSDLELNRWMCIPATCIALMKQFPVLTCMWVHILYVMHDKMLILNFLPYFEAEWIWSLIVCEKKSVRPLEIDFIAPIPKTIRLHCFIGSLVAPMISLNNGLFGKQHFISLNWIPQNGSESLQTSTRLRAEI